MPTTALLALLGRRSCLSTSGRRYRPTRERVSEFKLSPENYTPLGEVGFFTFEPHIRIVAGSRGYKYEEIYSFGTDGGVNGL
jgi:hypothetical protein